MKRTLLIVGGIVTVLILIAVWMYILFTGTTSENVSFNDFGFGDTTDPTVFIEPEPEVTTDEESESDVPPRLRQLTTRPVIGFSEIVTGTSSDPIVNYIEAGTGHIYSLNLVNGEEERVSATTIPQAREGVITPDGKHVLIKSGDGSQASYVVGTISENSDRLSNVSLDDPVTSFAATHENELLYSTPQGNNLVVKAYEPNTAVTRTLFTIPFRDAMISWHHTAAGPHIVYPRATSLLEGYVYSYTNGAVTRVNATGFGLSAVGSTESIIFGKQEAESYSTFSVAPDQLETAQTPVIFIPEKCAFSTLSPSIAVCGAGLAELPNRMPDPWYRGTLNLNDSIWEYNTEQQSARLLVSPETATGRQIDLINPLFSVSNFNLFFQNKADQTLWVYQYVLPRN